jgi:hypothetical protein
MEEDSGAGASLELQEEDALAAERYSKDGGINLIRVSAAYIRMFHSGGDEHFLELAKKALTELLEQDPDSLMAHKYLGEVYLYQGREDLAATEFFYAEQIGAEAESELLYGYSLPPENPAMHPPSQNGSYGLLPDPAMYGVFELVKEIPMDQDRQKSMQAAYGQMNPDELAAMHLRTIYAKIFDDKGFSSKLGLTDAKLKWEALLVFFVRGLNNDAMRLVKKSVSGTQLDVEALPAFSRHIVERFRREVWKEHTDGNYRALLMLPLTRLEALETAIGFANAGDGAGAVQALSNVGLATVKGKAVELALLEKETRAYLEKKASSSWDQKSLGILSGALVEKRLEYALELCSKMNALYGREKAIAQIKDALAGKSFSEDEKYMIMKSIG